MLAGGEIHYGVAPPADRPGHLLDLFANGGSKRGISDVGVDFHQEVSADDHRLRLRVVDVGRDDRPATRHLGTYEFGRDLRRNFGAEALPPMLVPHEGGKLLAHGAGVLQALDVLSPTQVLANCDVLHFGGDDPLPCVVHLGHILAGLGPARLAAQVKSKFSELGVVHPLDPKPRTRARQFFDIGPLLDPFCTQRRKPGPNVDRHLRIGVRAGGVIHPDRRVSFCAKVRRGVRLGYLPHRHPDIGPRPGDIGLL